MYVLLDGRGREAENGSCVGRAQRQQREHCRKAIWTETPHGTSHKPRLVLTLAALHSKLRLRPELRLSGGRIGLLAGELEEPRHTGKERNQMWAHVSCSLIATASHSCVCLVGKEK